MATRWVTNLGEGGPGHACMLGMLRCTLCRHVLGSVCTGATRATCAHAGTPYARLWGQLSEALAGLCGGGAAAAPYVELLLQDGELCSRLLRLLLPGIRAIAIGLQLPPERRPAECNWRAAECMALLVFSTAHMLSQVMIELGPAAGVHLMQAATQLLQHCPFPAAGSGQGTAGVFIGQLGAIAAAVPLRSHAVQRLPAPAKAVAAALPRQLLAVLPKVNEALAGAAQPPLLEELATPARSAASILQALCWAAKASDSITEPAALFHEEDLPAWLLGATTALRWLPMAAAALAADAGRSLGAAILLPQILPRCGRTGCWDWLKWHCSWLNWSATAALQQSNWPRPGMQNPPQQLCLSAWLPGGSWMPPSAAWCTWCTQAALHRCCGRHSESFP